MTMSAFKSLFGIKEKVSFPLTQELIPEKLTVIVDLVTIESPGGPLQCWKYTTQGYAVLGQKEMIFLLARDKSEAAEAFPQEPLTMFTNFEALFNSGLKYDIGDLPDFGGPGPFGRQVTFLPAQPVKGTEIAADALIPFLIDLTERNSIQDYGISRFIARLGKMSGTFPCPVWSQRQRAFLPGSIDQDTVLNQVERVAFPQIIVYQEGDAIYLINQPQMAARFRDNLPALIPVAFLTGLDPKADALLVWEAQQEESAAHIQPGKEGDHLCGSFLIIIPEQPENKWEIYEDGFCWMVTRVAWESIRKVLLAGRSIKATMVEEKLSFSLV
jgi:hypothetical protein